MYKLKGKNFHYKIDFIDKDRLIFFNDGHSVYSVNDFSAPVVKKILSNNYPELPYDMALSPDKSKIATRIFNNITNQTKVLWYNYLTTEDTTAVVDTFDVPAVDITSEMAISDSNDFIALSMGYGIDSVILINVATHETNIIATPQNGGTYSPVFFHNNGKLYLADGEGYIKGSIEIIDVAGKSLIKSVPAFANYNYSLSVDSTQHYLVCGGFNGEIKVMDIQNMLFDTLARDFTMDVITKVKFTRDDQYIVAGTYTPNVRVIVYKVIYNQVSSVLYQPGNDITIYPVPVKNILHINESGKAINAAIYTITGDLVFQKSVSDGTINMADLPAGTYLLRIFDGKNSPVIKKIVKH